MVWKKYWVERRLRTHEERVILADDAESVVDLHLEEVPIFFETFRLRLGHPHGGPALDFFLVRFFIDL